jgi:SOS-response transcriptional repressor LexA
VVAQEALYVHLTSRRREILESIADWHDTHGYAPTVREITRIHGLASVSTTHGHLAILRDEGVVDWVAGQNRTLHLTPLGRAVLVL